MTGAVAAGGSTGAGVGVETGTGAVVAAGGGGRVDGCADCGGAGFGSARR